MGTASIVARTFALTPFGRAYAKATGAHEPLDFSTRALDALGMSADVSDEQLRHIPPTGPLVVVANHPFGGAEGIVQCRMEIDRMRQDPTLPQSLREKFDSRDETLLPDLVLNCILNGTGISVVIPSMLQPKHLKTNVQAVDRCRFSPPELDVIRSRFARLNVATSR